MKKIFRILGALPSVIEEIFSAFFENPRCKVCNKFIGTRFGDACSCKACFVCHAPIEPGEAISLLDPGTGLPYPADMVVCKPSHVLAFQKG